MTRAGEFMFLVELTGAVPRYMSGRSGNRVWWTSTTEANAAIRFTIAGAKAMVEEFVGSPHHKVRVTAMAPWGLTH